MAKDFIIDLETLGSRPDSIVVDISVVVFDSDPTVMQSFNDLCNAGRRFKLDLKSQRGTRTTMASTIVWWKEQDEAAKKNLKASPEDLTVEEAIPQLLDYLKKSGVNAWKSQGWCRGMSFDFPILVDMIRQTFKTDVTEDFEPVKFWAQRDIRTAIESLALTRGLSMTPLRKGLLTGFVAHDSIHDCAKDVIMLKTAQRYALGLETMPELEDTDPQTIKTRPTK